MTPALMKRSRSRVWFPCSPKNSISASDHSFYLRRAGGWEVQKHVWASAQPLKRVFLLHPDMAEGIPEQGRASVL
jgi:hypothetical protein